jgi:hypothetical protein
MEKVKDRLVEWGVASLAMPGQRESGDLHLVKVLPPQALIAVVDGLGHGEEAAYAAKVAIKTLEVYAGESLIALVERCHQELRLTRGVVMSLACLNAVENTVAWLGVGNVEGLILHWEAQEFPGQEALVLRSGVVGDCLPPLATSIIQVGESDLLVFATDGIRPGFASGINLSEPPQAIADRILSQHGNQTDDALVLVARYTNG